MQYKKIKLPEARIITKQAEKTLIDPAALPCQFDYQVKNELVVEISYKLVHFSVEWAKAAQDSSKWSTET